MNNSRLHLALVLSAVVVLFASMAGGDFVWLDHQEIVNGAYRVTDASEFARVWVEPLEIYVERSDGSSGTAGGYWRPVYALSLSLDWWLWGPNPAAFHIENIAWHALVVLGLYVLGCLLLGGSLANNRVILLASLGFAVHPLATHSVSWISGRKDSMCAAFIILTLIFWHYALTRVGDRRHRAAFVAATVCLVLAVASKELGFVTPALAILVLWWEWPVLRERKSALRMLLGICAVSVGMLLVRMHLLGALGLGGSVYPSPYFWTNLFTSLDVLWHYASLVVWPRPALISDAWPIATSVDFGAIIALLAALAVLVLAVVGLYRRRPWAFGLVWAIVLLAPVSGLVPLRHFHAERYLYPAYWGLLLTLGFLAAELWRGIPAFKVPIVLLASVFVILAGYNTWVSNSLWQNDKVLFENSVARDPDYVEGLTALAKLALEEGRYAESIQLAEQALGLATASPRAILTYWSPMILHSNLGLALLHLDQYERAERHFHAALEARPNSALLHYQLGAVAFARQDYQRALRYQQQSLALHEDDRVRSALATTLMRLGELEEAARLFAPVVARHPDDRLTRNNYASTLLVLGLFDRAEQQFTKLHERGDADAIVLAKLAWCHLELGRPELARKYLLEALRIAPGDAAVAGIAGLLEKRGLDL